jgi:hypothetical protein
VVVLLVVVYANFSGFFIHTDRYACQSEKQDVVTITIYYFYFRMLVNNRLESELDVAHHKPS